MRLFCFYLALIIHEFAHGLTGYMLGDDGHDKRRRLRIVTIPWDAFGSIIAPLLLQLTELPIVGWAHSPHTHGERHYAPADDIPKMLLSGIAANLACASLGFSLWKLSVLPETLRYPVMIFVEANLLLAIVNVIPLQPFDLGSLLQTRSKTWNSIMNREFEMIISVLFIMAWYGLLGQLVKFYISEYLYIQF